MNDRIQKVLDGELDREALTAEERADLRRFAALLVELPAAIPTPDAGALTAAVMERVRGAGFAATSVKPGHPRTGRRSLLSWLWQPKRLSVRLRPASLLATSALVVLLVGGLAQVSGPRPDAQSVAGRDRLLVEFRFHAPEARAVALAGDFTGWEPAYELMPSGPGVWTVVVPLEPGVHDYAFVVDGDRWVPDPSAPAIGDGFGGYNSRVSVLAPDPESNL